MPYTRRRPLSCWPSAKCISCLLLPSIFAPVVRFHSLSRSTRRTLDMPDGEILRKFRPGAMSISGFVNRHSYRGSKMTDAAVMEAGSEWAIACEVQQRFMQHLCPAIDTLD